jgi:hypothetical protein
MERLGRPHPEEESCFRVSTIMDATFRPAQKIPFLVLLWRTFADSEDGHIPAIYGKTCVGADNGCGRLLRVSTRGSLTWLGFRGLYWLQGAPGWYWVVANPDNSSRIVRV